jgi:hypothetical protein
VRKVWPLRQMAFQQAAPRGSPADRGSGAFGPFIVLFGEDGADEADEGIAVGEDAGDVAWSNAPPVQKTEVP